MRRSADAPNGVIKESDMTHPFKRRAAVKKTLPIAVLAMAALACNTLSGLVGSRASTPTASPAQSTLAAVNPRAHCVQEGYPCSYADASPEALARSLELLDRASQVMESGGTIEQAAELVQGETDLADELHDRLALRFRIQGGPPMWLIDPAVMDSSSSETADHLGGLAAPAAGDGGPISNQDEGKEPEHKALILEPFLWDFKTNEGGGVRRVLAQNRNYSCRDCLTYKFTAMDDIDEDGDGAPDDFVENGVTLDYFRNWESYDLIHISSHGAQLCRDEIEFTPETYSPAPPSDCYTALFTGISLSEAAFKNAGGYSGFAIPGAVWARHPDKPECHSNSTSLGNFASEGCVEAGRMWLAVTADFFLFDHPGGYDDKFIFISACESMKGMDMATALAGDNTTVLGWTESVDAGVSARITRAFYKNYIVKNLRPEPAFEMTKQEEFNTQPLTSFKPKGGGSYTGAAPEIIRGGSPDPYGRELITIMHPIYQQELEEDGPMLVSGIPGDGQPDKLVFQARLEGIDDSQDPSDFVVHVNVNDKHLPGSYRPETQISDYAYLTKIEEVPLGFDVNGQDVVKIDAWVDLPEGGVSRHVIERARLASCGWTGSMSGTRSGPLSGDLVLNLKDFADVDPKILAQLGLPEGGLSMPDGPLVDTLMMTGHPPFPAFVVNDEGFASAIFSGPTDAAIGGGTQSPLRFSEQTDEYFAGTASATMLDARNGGNVTVSAQFVWNADSLCDIDLIAAAAANAPQGGESP